jgi:alkyl hydroperoxide reductase subunit AhpC
MLPALANLAVGEKRSGVSERALFVIDAAGMIRWRQVSSIDINPGAEGILRALDALPKTSPAKP